MQPHYVPRRRSRPDGFHLGEADTVRSAMTGWAGGAAEHSPSSYTEEQVASPLGWWWEVLKSVHREVPMA